MINIFLLRFKLHIQKFLIEDPRRKTQESWLFVLASLSVGCFLMETSPEYKNKIKVW